MTTIPNIITITRTPARVTVKSAAGAVLASSVRALTLDEKSGKDHKPYPARYYIPPGDVNFDELEPVEKTTYCPFKGTANRYWKVKGGETPVAWAYPEPFETVAAIKDAVAFWDGEVVVSVGEE